MKAWLKAKLLLLSVALVWAFFIYNVWEVQLAITLLGCFPNKVLRGLRYGFWIVQDQAVNVVVSALLLKVGNPDVTVSSKVGYMAEQGSKTAAAMAKVIDLLFKLAVNQDDHCAASIERDEAHY